MDQDKGSGEPATAKAAKADMASATPEADALELVKEEQRNIKQQLRGYGALADAEKAVAKTNLLRDVATYLDAEEEVILPTLAPATSDDGSDADAAVERDLIRMLLADIRDNRDEASAAAEMRVLNRHLTAYLDHQVKPHTGSTARLKEPGIDLKGIGQKLRDYKKTRTSAETNQLMNTAPRSLRLGRTNENWETDMNRTSNERERDSEGRFVSDDDRSSRGRYASNNGSSDNRSRDDEGRFTSGRQSSGYRSSNDRPRDDEGRFVSDDDRNYSSRSRHPDDDRNYSSRSRAQDDDRNYSSRSSRSQDDDRSSGRGHGGWFGDSEGHSEAARRGWDEREGSRSSSSRGYDDRGGYRSSSQSNDRGRDSNDRPRDSEGRFVSNDDRGYSSQNRGNDDRGYSSRSSRSNDDDRGGRGHGGWFGDSEGHSEAARRGWEDRDDNRSSSNARGNYDDRNDDNRSGRGHGGWFGDPEGHSEAARRGWDEREGSSRSSSSRGRDYDDDYRNRR